MAAIAHRLRCEILEARRLTAADVADSFNITVQSEGLAGLRAAEIKLDYDTQALALSDSDIRVGEAWEGTASLVTKVDNESGSVNIFLFSVEPIAADAGGLVDVKFQMLDQLAGDVAKATLSRVQLNEGAIESPVQLTTMVAPAANEESASSIVPQPIEAGNSDSNSDSNSSGDFAGAACGPWNASLSTWSSQAPMAVEMSVPISSATAWAAPPVASRSPWELSDEQSTFG